MERHSFRTVNAFACNAKSFAIAIIFLFLSTVFLDGLLPRFHRLLPRTQVVSPGKISLNSLKNIYVTNVSLNMKFRVKCK